MLDFLAPTAARRKSADQPEERKELSFVPASVLLRLRRRDLTGREGDKEQ
jgi:hypothetical protein